MRPFARNEGTWRCRLLGHRRNLIFVDAPRGAALWITSWSDCVRCGEPYRGGDSK